ncbi:MAG: hypothetical protein CMJ75_02555 [Planctomycetaceae bacterium]|nr:hypothetical protein [Planctomycetaceae bacterium]
MDLFSGGSLQSFLEAENDRDWSAAMATFGRVARARTVSWSRVSRLESWLDLSSLETSFFERSGAFEVFDDWQPTPRRTYRYYGAHGAVEEQAFGTAGRK